MRTPFILVIARDRDVMHDVRALPHPAGYALVHYPDVDAADDEAIRRAAVVVLDDNALTEVARRGGLGRRDVAAVLARGFGPDKMLLIRAARVSKVIHGRTLTARRWLNRLAPFPAVPVKW